MPLHIVGTALDEEVSALTIGDTTRMKEAVAALMLSVVEGCDATVTPMQARALLAHMVSVQKELMRLNAHRGAN